MPVSSGARVPSWRFRYRRRWQAWRRVSTAAADVAAQAVAVCAVLACLSMPAVAQHEGAALSAARDLYAAARYDEALAVLNGLAEHADRKSVEQYRSLCLLALGRPGEAEQAVAAVVMADPAYQPGEADTSPRVRAMFTEVRRRLLPGLATERYVAAKATYDRREWELAEQQFQIALSLIDDPDTGGRLGDLRLLAVGFLELSARAALPAEAPSEPPAGPVPPLAADEPPPGSPELPLSPAPSPDEPAASRIYAAEDGGVTPPVTVRQDIPLLPAAVRSRATGRGLLDIVIDERGRVVSMSMRESIHPTYDTQVFTAARDWKYEPATVEGQPVKFRKLINITVKR